MSVMPENTNDSNRNDNDSNSCNDGNYQVDVGKEVHDRVLEAFAATALTTVSRDLSSGS